MRVRPIGKLTRSFADQGLGQFFWKASNAFSRASVFASPSCAKAVAAASIVARPPGTLPAPDTVPARCIIDVTDPHCCSHGLDIQIFLALRQVPSIRTSLCTGEV